MINLHSLFKNNYLNISRTSFGSSISEAFKTTVFIFLYFCLISPISIIFKLVKRDELRLKRDNYSSWVYREHKLDPNNFKKQY